MSNTEIKDTGMKKILIALDYNPSAEKVAKTGYDLAKAMQAKIVIVHVYSEPAFYAADYSPIMGYQGAYTEGARALIDEIKNEGTAFLAAVVRHLGDPAIQTAALSGDSVEATILEYAEQQAMDLIVIGSHTRHGIGKLLKPDLSVHLVKHSAIPLLIIPTDK